LKLAQRRYIIQNPESAPVRADGDVVVFDNQIADGRSGQIKSKRLPVVAVIERNVNRTFGSREQQAFALRVFTHDVNDLPVGNSLYDFRPSLSIVSRSINMRSIVINAQSVYRRVSRVVVKMRR